MSEEEKEAIINQYEDLIQSLPGRILPKRYRIEGMLSTNPFSALFQAVYEPEEKLVTLRVFRTLIKSEEDYQYKRFKQEAKKLINMRHPNIAKVLDIGLLDEGLPYIVLENIIGPTLEQVLVHQNRVDPDQVVLIFTQVARAVQAAHDQGILHESLQPDRITITETETGDAVVRTSGFGMISMHNKLGIPLKTPKSKLTFIGTANYMSPEQCYDGAEVDGRSDVYSIGCLIYECLSGQVPFMAPAEEVMRMQIEMDPTPVEALRKDLVFPKRLLAVMQKCINKDVTRRYQFVRDLQYDLEQDIDPAEREQRTVIPEAIQKAEQRVKDNKETPLKLIGTIVAGVAGLIVVLFVGSYIASMTGKMASESGWQSKLEASRKALKEGKLEDAKTSADAALEEAKKFPPPDIRYAQTQTEEAAISYETGRYTQTLKDLRDALSVEEQAHKDKGEAAARTLELLSAAELSAGKFGEAEEHAHASADISEHLTGEKTIRLYESYYQLLRVLVANGKLDEARAALEKIKNAIGSTDIILTMDVISGKKQAEAILNQANKKYADAEKQFEDVLGSRQEKLGTNSLACIDTMILLGKLYAIEGKMQKSTALLQSAFEAKEKAIGDTSPALADLALSIANIYDSAKHKVESEKYYRQALELAEKSWGKGKIETLPYVDALAKLLRSNGEKKKAEVYESEAMDIRHPERVSKLGQ